MSERYTVCTTKGCHNSGKAATHPRSPTPRICGVCKKKVRFVVTDKIVEEVIK